MTGFFAEDIIGLALPVVYSIWCNQLKIWKEIMTVMSSWNKIWSDSQHYQWTTIQKSQLSQQY